MTSIGTSQAIAARQARWEALQDMSLPYSPVWTMSLEGDTDDRPYPWPTNVPERIEWAWKDYLRDIDRLSWLDDDTIPCLDPYTGTEIFAAAFGCSVYRPTDNMPFALPLINSADEVSSLKVPSIDVAPLRVLFEIGDELRRRAGPEAIMRLPDMQSPFDIAALIWDKRDFYTAVVDAPDAVHELTAKVESLVTEFIDAWFARYGTAFIAHYPHYYMREGITMSVDEVGAISPSMAAKFVMPELARLSTHFGGLGVHCCANARHQWANFKRLPGLRLMNLFSLERPGILHEASAYFADHVAQLHAWDEPYETWLPTMPPTAHIAIDITARDEEDAKRRAAELQRTYRP